MTRSTVQKIGKWCGVGAVTLAAIIGYTSYLGRQTVEKEWQSKFPEAPRARTDVRGLINNMVSYRHETIPAFIPQAGWDEELCAANVEGAVNLLLGEDKLRPAKAWEFAQVNRDKIKLVYERERDFAIENGAIVEKIDSRIWLAKILSLVGEPGNRTSDRLYVVGYHYHFTHSDSKIIEAREHGGTLNSHLMLLLGRYDGSWWGYHLLHDKEDPNVNPFKITNLGDEIPKEFDLAYVWEVLGTQLPSKEEGSPLLFVQNSPDYGAVRHLLGWLGKGKIGYVFDNAIVQLFGQGENYPRVVSLATPLAEVVPPDSSSGWRGQILGFYQSTAVRRQRGDNRRGVYGLEFQCTELVNRYLVGQGHRNLSHTGNADSYYLAPTAKGLEHFANGGQTRPEPGDLLVFDGNTGPGHIGIVYQVTENSVCLVQQNTPYWHECLPLHFREGWHVEPITPDLPCLGWSRRKKS